MASRSAPASPLSTERQALTQLALPSPYIASKIRCNAQWHRVVFKDGTFHFPDHDWQMNEANLRLGGEPLACDLLRHDWATGRMVYKHHQFQEAQRWAQRQYTLRRVLNHGNKSYDYQTPFGKYFIRLATPYIQRRLPGATCVHVQYYVTNLEAYERNCPVLLYNHHIEGIRCATVRLIITPDWWREVFKQGKAFVDKRLVLGKASVGYYVLGKYHSGAHPYFAIERYW